MTTDEPSLPRPVPPPPPAWGPAASGPAASGPGAPPPPPPGPPAATRRHRFASVVAILLGLLIALLALAPFAEVDGQNGHNVTFAGTPWSLLVLALAVVLIVFGVRTLRSSQRIGSLVPTLALVAMIPFTIAGMVSAHHRADDVLLPRAAFSATSNYSVSPGVIIFLALVAAAAWFLRGVILMMRNGGARTKRP